jgi:hypothetical protein
MFKNIFAIVSIAAMALVSNPVKAQAPDSDLLENKDYETLSTLKQTSNLGNSYNRYLKRTDPETGEVQRWLLSTKPVTGFALKATIEGYNYDRVMTFLPMIGIAYVGPHLIPEIEVGLANSKYMDAQSDQYGEDYKSIVARIGLLWKVYRSSAKDQMLEKSYFAFGPGFEYNNRRNSFQEVTETAQSKTIIDDDVQGSSYALFFKAEYGVNFPSIGLTLAGNAHIGYGRDYRGSGTISCTRYGAGITARWVISTTKYTKLGKVQKSNPEKFRQILANY